MLFEGFGYINFVFTLVYFNPKLGTKVFLLFGNFIIDISHSPLIVFTLYFRLISTEDLI